MIADIYELSPMQRAMLFHAAYAPQSVSHFSQFSCKLSGDLKPDLFHQAWLKLVERHPVLRTSFHWEGLDKPVQVVHDKATLPWVYQDWRSHGAPLLDGKWQEYLLADRKDGFALDRPPLMRCLLVRTAEDQYLFNWSHHHILMDGWCLSLVMEEFFEIYGALRSRKPLDLPPAVPYRTYIEWLQRQDMDEARDYWINYLKGFRAATELPTRRAQVPVRPEAGELVQRRLSEWLSQSLRRVAGQHQITPNVLAQGAWALLLSRQSGERDVLFGATVAGRPTDLPGAGRMLGLFINTIPVRVRVEERATLVDWLKHIQARQAARSRYEYTPLSDIQRWGEGLRGGPLFNSNVIFMNYPLNETLALGAGGLIISEPQIHDQTNILLQLQVTPGAEWTVEINYDGEGFERATVERMLDHVCALLEAFARTPTRTLSELSLLSEAERGRLLTAFNRSAVPFDASDSFIHRFERTAAAFPSRVAASCSGRSLSYSELNAGANRLARHLLRRCTGLGADQLVAILCRRSERMMQSILAVWKCGAAYMPLEASDPPARLCALVKESGATVVITEAGLLREELAAQLSAHAAVVNLDDLPREVEGAKFEAEGCDLNRRTAAGDLAYVIYTSGSTGNPKGVMVEQAGLLNHLLAKVEELGLDAQSVVAQTAAQTFDISVWQFCSALLVGGRTVIFPDEVVMEPPHLLESMEENRVSILEVVPSYLGVLLERLAERPARLEHLEYLLVTGEALSPALVESWFGLSAVPLVNAYGPTEASDDVTHHRMDGPARDGAVPVGRPLRNLRIYVVDEWMNLCPLGVRGEVCVGGVGVGRGYLDDPRKTAAAFVPDPFSQEAGARLYRTGDVGSWTEDGHLVLHGRKDFQVKVRGHRIELGEIESALTQLDCVHEAVVRDVRDAAGHVYLCGYVTLRAGRQADGADLAHALSKKLPDYMVPAAFTLLEKFSLTRNGKIDRQALPAPDLPKEARKAGHAPPRTDAERALCLIWSEVLGVEQPGIHDNFFALGGDSILSMQIVSRAGRAGFKLLTRQVFEHQTIAELARVATPTTQAERETGEVRGPIPLTPIQHRFFLQHKPKQHHYNQSVMIETPAGLDPMILRQALQIIVSHHDALRLRFHLDGHNWFQQIADVEDAEAALQVEDVSFLPADEQHHRIEAVCAAAHAGLDLSAGPLLRSVLFQRGGEQKPLLLLVAHHLIVDSVSWRILLEDLSAAYRQLRANEEPRLPDTTTTFGEWATLLAEVANPSADLAREYWHSLELAPAAPLPLDGADDPRANVVSSTQESTSSLSEQATRALLQQAGRAYNTLINDLLLAALALTLKEWTGEEYLLIDLEGHGREPWIESTDLSRTVGWFTTLFPVGLNVLADGPGEVIKSVKEQLRLVPSAGFTYGLFRYLAGDSVPGPRSAAQIVFNYLGQIDAPLPADPEWTLSQDSTGPGRNAEQRREYVLEVNSYVSGGRLHTHWGYSRNLHAEATVRRLAEGYSANLEKLIAHCLEPAAFGFTPSDFPAAGVSQSSLDELVRQLKSAPRQPLRDEVEDIYELTPTQQGMLFHSLYTPSSEAYFNQVTCLIVGELDTETFLAAWRQTIDRHPVLRTSFHWEGIEKPVQVVHRSVSLPWDEVDLSGVEETEALERWDGLLRESRARGFEMSEAPLMRWTLAYLGQSRYRFSWSEHHLLLDGWSASLVLGEVLEAYAAMRAGREAMLPHPRPFRDMVTWLRQQETTSAERFWRERLAGFTTPTPLILGRPEMEGARAPELYSRKESFLSPSATARLVSFARNNHLSLNTLAQGAWALLLSRYSGETDVVYGTIVSGRPPELEGSDHMVGLFINTTPVRAQLDESEAAAAWLKRMQARLVEQEQYAYSPLAEIQKWSEVAGGTPLFESLLIFQNYPVGEGLDKMLTGVRISEFEVFDPNNYPLTLVVTPGEALSLRVLYDAGRFDEETVARLTGHYQTILESIVAAPDQPLERVEMLTAGEREQILSEWNRTAAEVPAGKTVVDLFESHAARTPDRVALVCGNVRRTYRELSERSTALARHLQGAAPLDVDDRVAIFMGRSTAMVESILAVWKCGAAYVPVDPNYPAERIERILADAKPRLILAEGDAALANLPAESPVVRLDALPPSSTAPAPIESKALPHGLAYVIYTSGSTGKPKGAMVEHRGMLNHILGMVRDLEIDEQSVIAETASHCFDISVWQFFAAPVSGARTHIYTDEVVLQPAELARLLDRDGVNVVQFVPSYLTAFVDELRSIHPPQPLTSLSFMVLIGEILKPAYVKAWFALHPGVRMMNAYGPTEASDSVTHFVMDRPPELASIPVGRPVQNLKVYILDKHRRLCPVGVRGEICVAGVGVGRGYLFDPERTGAVFEHDPFSEDGQGRLYHTGDIGCYAPDGNILFFGRNDFQVKIRGHRIELGDVESAITGLDGITNAAVVAREEASGAKYLCAYVSQSGSARWSATTLRDAMRRKLPEHMLPDVWMILPELPVTPNGKVNRQSLPEPAGHGAARPSPEPPATRVEKVLASIWQDVLGRPVGVEDRFFEVGGHSLHAVRIVSRIRRDLGVDATLAQLFTSDTVRALARELSDSAPHITTRIPVLPEQVWYDASHAQKRIWLACRTAEASISYNMAGAFRLDGRLHTDALVEALNILVKRHESLRTVFAFMGGELKQQVRSPEECGFEVARLEAPSSVADLVTAEAERPFNLADGPLFRAALARVGEESHLLLLTMHHIISDAWSVRVLVNELRVLYDAFRSGRPSPLEPLPIQYRDYAAWHNRMLESREMRSQRDYWRRLLGPHVSRLELPTDYPRAARNGRAGGRVAALVDRDTAKGLSGLAQRHGTSLFGAVLASICVLLYRYTGRQEIVIGFQSAGRDQPQLEEQVGVYLNTVVLSARLEPAASVAETVSSIGRSLLEALRHGDYPFDLLLEEVRPRTPANRSPIFDVQVDYVPDLDPASSADAKPEIIITDLSQDLARTKYDISFLIFESAEKLEVVTVYDANLFRRETIETMHQRLAAIQKAFLENEGRTIGEIELFGETTRAAGRRVEVGLRLSKDK